MRPPECRCFQSPSKTNDKNALLAISQAAALASAFTSSPCAVQEESHVSVLIGETEIEQRETIARSVNKPVT